ncbi:hypothetical protein GCM10012287_50120 [Streptomyces daqingensis]|uniref:Transposase n=1 Tax=Streptomyces daqingensis TaxID=1472640 RepID=A0ABQ2MQ92_9ACTN|nr:hypothetical protein GCM10012287_50120 [Streptomyces daqingensis]
MAWLPGWRRLHRRYEPEAADFLALTSIASSTVTSEKVAVKLRRGTARLMEHRCGRAVVRKAVGPGAGSHQAPRERRSIR